MVFVIVYALFIFVDLAVATASNVRPSQHQCLVGGECVRLDEPQPSPSIPCHAHLVLCSPTAALWLLPHLCPAPPVPTAAVCVLALWLHRSLLCTRTPAHQGWMRGLQRAAAHP